MQFGRSNEMSKGLTGWLSPQGEFFPCEYAEHSYLASEMFENHRNSKEMNSERVRINNTKGTVLPYDDSLREMFWIPMGRGYLFISNEGRTQEQINWFEDNYEKLSDTQKEMLDEHIEDYLALRED
jgi:hypothetical protein